MPRRETLLVVVLHYARLAYNSWMSYVVERLPEYNLFIPMQLFSLF